MAELLTKEQRAAVEDRGRSLLVSAAAGSGKTKVLVERLFSYVEQDGCNIDDFLIITYTRAAAAELRGKIAKALSERLEREPGSARLQRQTLRVYRADIKTVDAFCTALLRENCHLLGEDENGHALRPDFRVLDEQEAELLKNRTLARVIERFYDTLTPGGAQLADTLGAGRDDSALCALVLELYGKLQAQSDVRRWLGGQKSLWKSVPERIEETPYGAILLTEIKNKALYLAALLERAAQEMAQNAALSQKYAPAFLDVGAQLGALACAAERSWDETRESAVAFPRLAPVKDSDGGALKARMKSLWDGCKSAVKGSLAALDASSAEAAEDLRAVAPAMLALLELTGEFSARYQSEKRRRNAADFSDQEHEALRLLLTPEGEPSELACTVSQRYREIMVDEYQDTNEVQNRIFDAISRNGRNLFTVGDVKQSIYRFRLADPRIFLHHYSTYPDAAQAADGESAKLLLSRNFRSRKEVLEAVNFIFSNILSRELGELDYGEAERLYPGAAYEEKALCATEFHLLDLPTQSGEERVSAAQAEAGFVADYIRKLLSSGFTVQDETTREERAVREEDIVILMRSPRPRLTAYRAALEARGLRTDCEGSEDFFSAMEVAVVFSLLEIIDNPRQDVPLISVLRSPLFSFTPDLLSSLRAKTPQGDFYDALLAGEDAQSKDFLETLGVLRERAAQLGVYELIFEIFRRCNVLGVFGAVPGGEERRENLLAFAQLAAEQESSGRRGLFAFVSYLRELLQSGQEVSPLAARSAGGVRIMSIHKSKGLEFPVVILADLAKRFSNMDFTTSVLVHPQLGLGPVAVDTQRRIRYPTAARRALEHTLRREAKSEELRMLYVAMTRAKEKLIMVHTQANAEKRVSDLLPLASCPALPDAMDGGKCMGDWLMLPLLCRTEAGALRALAGQEGIETSAWNDAPWLVQTHEGLMFAGGGETRAPEEKTPEEAPTFDAAALSYRYPYARETALPAKLTATQLKGRALDAEISENAPLPPRLRSLEKPRFLAGSEVLSGAERGTAIHLLLQFLDFSAQSEREVRLQVEELRARRLLTQEQADAVDVRAVAAFLQSPLAARVRKSAHVEREYRFSLLRPASGYDAAVTSDDALLLQGVVDCFFEEDGALVVLDFKTDRITRAETAEHAERYRAQLTAYAQSLEMILEKSVKEKVLYFFSTGETVIL